MGELVTLSRTLSPFNPFRTGHPQIGTLTEAGPTYSISNVTSGNVVELALANDGNLTIKTTTGTLIWSNGYSNTTEPLVQSGTVDPLQDVCGKRLTSCRARFGQYAELPFGSFPSVGTFYQ